MEQLFRPQLVGETPEENFRQLTDYLYQLTEQLEFILDNIGEDNLSAGLVNKLNSLGANIDANATLTSEAQSRIGSLDIISVADVINSPMFQTAMSTQAETLRGDMDTKDNAVKTAVTPTNSGFGVKFKDANNTVINYGKYYAENTSQPFDIPFADNPLVVTYPIQEYQADRTAITSQDGADFYFIAIGKGA